MRTYSKSCKLPPCKIDEQALRYLAGLVTSGLSAEEIGGLFSVSTNLADGEVRAHSIDEFLQDGMPGELTNLFIHLWGQQKSLTVTIVPNGSNRLSVEGADQGWVLTRHDQITAFFAAKRVRVRPVVKRALFLVNTFILLPLALFNIVASIAINQPAAFPFLTWGVGIVELFVVPALIIDAARPYSQIALTPKGKKLTPDNTLVIMVIFTVLSGVGGIGGFIAAVLALRK